MSRNSHKRSHHDDHHSGSSKRSRKRSRSPSPDIYGLRHDLSNYLEDNLNIRNPPDFWKFHLKYEAAQKAKQSQFDSTKLIRIDFTTNSKVLYEKLPLYNRRGDRIHISGDKFKSLLRCVLTYQDFQLKTKFSRLKSLRNAQNDLPMARYKREIIKTVNENNVILIAGDTGCGKSTQVPQFILEAGFERIACTQPRRIACVSLAKRVAHETLTSYKNMIGFQIRFEKAKNKSTNIIFMTEGILLRQASDADVLTGYDAIILDEVHERHLNMDFLVGIMKCLLQKRSFKLILMSATINLRLFEEYFAGEGVKTIKVPGRLYPIDIIYKPVLKDVFDGGKKSSRFDAQPYLNILELIDSKYKPNEKGDVLVFLSGFSGINALAAAVGDYAEIKKNWVVLQLHSSLSLEEQDKVFYAAPEGVRKCIISTNIAETSVTIDGVRFVIDSGKCNRMIYENCGVNRLFETAVSQDSAKQRAGRAGRTGPGYCYRLYSEEELAKFETFTPAEIHLVPLENLILSMVTLGLSDIEQFPFLEKPSSESLRSSLERLSFLEALKSDEHGLSLTTLGNALSRLPVDLTISKMLIISTVFGTVNSALALASLLSVQTPLIENKYFETREGRKAYESSHGEPITYINLYKGWLEIKREGSYGRSKSENSRTWSKRRGVEEQRFYEVTKLIEQFRDILQDAELIPKLENESLNSSERSIRNGELKRLRDIRRDLKNDSKDTKRKKLNLQTEDDDTNTKDLRDIEFRISNDFRKLQQLLQDTRTDSYKDLMLLKLLLTAALYPQIAIEDEHNSSKTVNQRLYHTKVKNYISLRPTSYFSDNPDFLQLSESDIDVPPNGYFSKSPLSRKHQLLVFQKLLETNKTYLINTYRMPALETLLLFGRKIATNRTLTKFIVDDFITIDCPFLWQGKVLLLKSIDLRLKLKAKLEQKLGEQKLDDTDEDKFYLVQQLTDFMQSSASYNIKRLLPADIKVVYSYESERREFTSNPFDENHTITPNNLGGFNVTENVIYDCLVIDNYDVEVENILQSNPFVCEKCEQTILGLGFFEVLQHERSCKKVAVDAPKEDSVCVVKPNSKKFRCDKCGKDLLLTSVDFLKHKKFCVPVKVEKNS